MRREPLLLVIGVFFLGIVATDSVAGLSQSPAANGEAFGVGLTGAQEAFYSWLGLFPFLIALSVLLFLAAPDQGDARSASAASGKLPPSPSTIDARRWSRERMATTGVRAALIVTGAILIVGLVISGAVNQIGLAQCCDSQYCGPQPGVCPWSLTGLWLTVAFLAGCAAIVALGVTPARRGFRGSSVPHTEGPGRASAAWSFVGALCAFFGWGLLVLGLLLPWDYFGGRAPHCFEPCVYAYVLAGIPLSLVIAGASALALAALILSYVLVHDRRVRRGPASFSTGGFPTSSGPATDPEAELHGGAFFPSELGPDPPDLSTRL